MRANFLRRGVDRERRDEQADLVAGHCAALLDVWRVVGAQFVESGNERRRDTGTIFNRRRNVGDTIDRHEFDGLCSPSPKTPDDLRGNEQSSDLALEHRATPIRVPKIELFDDRALIRECWSLLEVMAQQQVVSDGHVAVEDDLRVRPIVEALQIRECFPSSRTTTTVVCATGRSAATEMS